MKLLGSTKIKITKNENGENLSHLEITEVVLTDCSIVNNDISKIQESCIKFFPNKSFGQLLDISPKNVVFLKTFNSEFLDIEVWFTDQNSKPLEIEDKRNIALVNQ